MKRSISPMRYPGGKAKMYTQIVSLLEKNNLKNKIYIEPFAGGCGLALLLLQNGDVDKIILNDIDRGIYALWDSILNRTDEFCELIENISVSVEEREKQKKIQQDKENIDLLELGFSTFFLNRVNHSGVIKGGAIGGISQKGNFKIDCRFNKVRLIEQIRSIAKYRKKIKFYNLDVIEFIDRVVKKQKKESFIFFDPPYYNKGHELYTNFYTHDLHLKLSKKIGKLDKYNWIVTYDNVPEIKEMYNKFRNEEFNISYTLTKKRIAKEVIIYSDKVKENI